MIRGGELLPENHFTVPDLDGERFCRSYCAEEAYGSTYYDQVAKDCMRCEQTFWDSAFEEFCPKCRRNMNRLDM